MVLLLLLGLVPMSKLCSMLRMNLRISMSMSMSIKTHMQSPPFPLHFHDLGQLYNVIGLSRLIFFPAPFL